MGNSLCCCPAFATKRNEGVEEDLLNTQGATTQRNAGKPPTGKKGKAANISGAHHMQYGPNVL